MAICKFFLEGRCRFGDSCKNEHPRNQSNSNRFAPLNAPQGPGGPGRGRSGAFAGGSNQPEQFGVTTEGIRLDLTENKDGGERPQWPLSSYAPGKDAPKQLLEGPFEQSQEEMRVQCYLARASAQEPQYAQHEAALAAEVNGRIQQIKSNLEAAKKYVIDGQNEHPNRIDETQQPSNNFSRPNAPTQQSGGFGQPSTFGANNTAAPGFGQPSAPKPAFGAASSMGQSSGGFGQPSQLGGGSAFGKPSGMGGGGSAFGQASSMGQQSNPFGGAPKPPGFGQPSQPGAGPGAFGGASQPAFGQSGFGGAAKPAFGAPSQPAPAFGQPSQPLGFGQPSQPSGFGQPSQPGQTPAFGQPSQPAQTPAFGQPSQPAQTAGFGQPSQPAQTSAFGKPSQPSGFGQTNAFGQPSQPGTNAFGAKPSPFGGQAQNQPNPNPFGGNTASSNQRGGLFVNGTNANQAPANAPTAPNGKAMVYGPNKSNATSWKGKRLVRDNENYPCIEVPDRSKQNGRRLERVWFPDGPPATNVQNEDAVHDPEGPAEAYQGELGQTLKGLYEFVLQEGKFKDGLVPEIPPMMAWVGYDC